MRQGQPAGQDRSATGARDGPGLVQAPRGAVPSSLRRLAWLLGAASGCLAACDVADDVVVRRARHQLVGISANDLRLCAGPPNRTIVGDGDLQYWAYDRTATTSEVMVTTLALGFNLTQQGECSAVFELAGGHVRRIAFPRAVGGRVSPYSACVPLVQECYLMQRGGAIGPAFPAQAPEPEAQPETAPLPGLDGLVPGEERRSFP